MSVNDFMLEDRSYIMTILIEVLESVLDTIIMSSNTPTINIYHRLYSTRWGAIVWSSQRRRLFWNDKGKQERWMQSDAHKQSYHP
jgi:hypothetical protein